MSGNLSKAVNSGNLNQVKRILETTDASKKDVALMLAAMKGKTEIAKAMLEMGANPNVAAPSKATPLGLGIGYPAIVKILLQHGANPNQVVDENDNTPLVHAIIQNKIPSIMFLLQAGADVNHINRKGANPLVLAFQNHMHEIGIKLLDLGANPNTLAEGISSLQFACASDPISIPLIKKLLEKGADINYVEPEAGKTALHFAAYSQKKEVIELLLEAGANTEARDAYGHTPEYYAGPLQYLFYRFPAEYESVALEPGSENSIQEEIEEGNVLAMLNPAFPEQRIVAKRKGKPTTGWKYLFETRKNPLTRQNINLTGLTFKKATLSSGNKNRKSRKTRKQM
jgi:hypothetical protein